MTRPATRYSRLLVLLGLVPLLLLDLMGALPEGGFVGGGALIMAFAAIVHFYYGERLAGAGWLVFGGALGLVAVVDPTTNPLYLGTFIVLLISGLLLLISQHRVDADES